MSEITWSRSNCVACCSSSATGHLPRQLVTLHEGDGRSSCARWQGVQDYAASTCRAGCSLPFLTPLIRCAQGRDPRAGGDGSSSPRSARCRLLTDAVEKVAAEKLWNTILQQSNPAGRSLESTLRIRDLILNQCLPAGARKILFRQYPPTADLTLANSRLKFSFTGLVPTSHIACRDVVSFELHCAWPEPWRRAT
jgi:hypothetical protein